MYSLQGKRVYVAGHRGMVGSALMRRLGGEECRLLTAGREALDLRDQAAVDRWFDEQRPQAVFLAAARVGGIQANASRPGEFLYDNLAITVNVIEAARRSQVEKLLFLGSSCIYPRLAPQPMPESCLLTGPLEPSNEAYAIAKIAGLKLCRAYRRQYGCDFVSVMPTNLYGPKTVEIWGTGRPRREFLHVDDLADAVVFLMKSWSEEEPINIGSGEDMTIAELARMIARVLGFTGRFVFDPTKPDGAPRKLLDVAKLTALGWRPRIDFAEGLRQTYDWYRTALAR